MSYYEYKKSIRIEAEDYPFYALIMAAFRQADSDNLEALKTVFPVVWAEFQTRYHALGGYLEDEWPADEALARDLEQIRGRKRPA